MMQSAFSARLAIRAQQARLDAIAHNISNVNTYGFKSSRVTFKDTLYSAITNTQAQGGNLQKGTGVIISGITRSFEAGTPVETGEQLDFMILGEGFFTVQRPDGTIAYTRSGSFGVSSQGGGNYLVTPQGYFVLDENGERITIPAGANDIGVSPGGAVYANGTQIATLGIASFDNPGGLIAMGENCFIPSAASGGAFAASSYTVRQGWLEGSNVDLAAELVTLIRTQRAYSLASRALATADEMDRTANDMRA